MSIATTTRSAPVSVGSPVEVMPPPARATDRPTDRPTDRSVARRAADLDFWPIEPGLTMLNHGSYGVCPRPVIEAHFEFRRLMESDPPKFFIVELERRMDLTRRRLGEFLGVDPDWIAPCGNASIALATCIKNAGIRAGDDLLVTSHEYSSGLNELKRMSAREGFRVVMADIPFPIQSPQQAIDAILEAITPKTRLAIVSHITSATALVLPIDRIVRELRARGIEVIADGAHTAGQVPVNLRDLPFSWYTGSLHKWLCTPKGTGFMLVPPDKQATFRPMWLSTRAEKGRTDRKLFHCDFDYTGTSDFTASLTVPTAIDTIASLKPGGWPEVMKANHDLAVRGRSVVCEMLGFEPSCPDDMVGSMASIILPEPRNPQPKRLYDDALQDNLRDHHKIQIPVWRFGAQSMRLCRLSAHLYNTLDDYRKLGEALKIELARER